MLFLFPSSCECEIDDETNDSLENYRRSSSDGTCRQHAPADHVDIMTKYYIREVPESEADLDKDEFFDLSNLHRNRDGR